MTRPKNAGPPGFAEGTEVDVPKSRAELERLLQRHGAEQCLTGSDYQTRAGFVAFAIKGRHYRYNMPAPAAEEGRLLLAKQEEQRERRLEQKERERWRALVLIVKAKLEMIRAGMSSPGQEFLAQLVLPDGTLLGDKVEPQVEKMYRTGKMLPLLPVFKMLPAAPPVEGELED